MWKKIKEFEDYEVSIYGEVKSHKYEKEIILKKRYTQDGYIQYVLLKDGKSYTKRAHRLVAEAFISNPEYKETVNHIDGNKTNNYYKNLEWATKKEQMQHAYNLGLKKPMKGELNYNHVLTEPQVIEIRKLYKPHNKEFGMKALAKKYKVSEATINRVVHNRSYKNIK